MKDVNFTLTDATFIFLAVFCWQHFKIREERTGDSNCVQSFLSNKEKAHRSEERRVGKEC